MTPTQPAGEPTTMRHDGEIRTMATTGRMQRRADHARGGLATGWAAGWVAKLGVWLGTLVLLLWWAAPAAAQGPAGTIEYYGTDEVGSVRIIFSPTGTVVGRADYQPFGEEFNIDPAFARIRFGGQETDVEAGFQYFNARFLQTRTGRFEKPDPIFSGGAVSNPQLWNRYAYALNSPLAVGDPSGLYAVGGVTSGEDYQLSPIPPLPREPFCGWCGVLPPEPFVEVLPPDPGPEPGPEPGPGPGPTPQPTPATPTPTTPTIVGGTDGDRTELTNAIDEASKRLANPSCSWEVTGSGTPDVGRHFLYSPGTEWRFARRLFNVNGDAAAMAVTYPHSGGVDTRVLVNGSLWRSVEYSPVVQVLHETGHATGQFGPDYGLGMSQANSRAVIARCGR